MAVGYLLVSGVHIFLDFPELYWGKVGFRGHPAASRLADWGHFSRSMWPRRASPDGTASIPGGERTSPPVPPGPRYGPLQGIAYLSMIFGVIPLLFLTGTAQMPAFTAIAPWLIDVFGGRQTARTVHVIATLAVVLFALVHVGQVIAAGLVPKVGGMITGRTPLPEE